MSVKRRPSCRNRGGLLGQAGDFLVAGHERSRISKRAGRNQSIPARRQEAIGWTNWTYWTAWTRWTKHRVPPILRFAENPRDDEFFECAFADNLRNDDFLSGRGGTRFSFENRPAILFAG